jgi:uncharacterized protein (DUF58 family)
MIAPAEAFQSIRRLQIKALRHVEDVFAGNYRSTFKGTGLEFEEVREYQTGDDVRTIDWNVTARSQRPFVKNFREERELTVMLVVDISASSHFGHVERFKSEMIAELAALLAFSAIKNQDKVGLLLFTNEVELYLKPKKGVRHVLRVIRELLYFKPHHRGTDLPKALAFLGRIQRKKVICFLISDFLTKDFALQAALIAKRHELIAFHVYDDYERLFAPQGLFSLRDLENHDHALIDTADRAVQFQFKQRAQEQGLAVKQLFERIGADYLSMHTGEPSANVLHRFFRLRGRKR